MLIQGGGISRLLVLQESPLPSHRKLRSSPFVLCVYERVVPTVKARGLSVGKHIHVIPMLKLSAHMMPNHRMHAGMWCVSIATYWCVVVAATAAVVVDAAVFVIVAAVLYFFPGILPFLSAGWY